MMLLGAIVEEIPDTYGGAQGRERGTVFFFGGYASAVAERFVERMRHIQSNDYYSSHLTLTHSIVVVHLWFLGIANPVPIHPAPERKSADLCNLDKQIRNKLCSDCGLAASLESPRVSATHNIFPAGQKFSGQQQHVTRHP